MQGPLLALHSPQDNKTINRGSNLSTVHSETKPCLVGVWQKPWDNAGHGKASENACKFMSSISAWFLLFKPPTKLSKCAQQHPLA